MSDLIYKKVYGPEEGLEVEVVRAKAGGQSPSESHDFSELLILVDGIALVDIGDERRRRFAPDLLIIPPGIQHQVTITSDTATIVVIHDRRE